MDTGLPESYFCKVYSFSASIGMQMCSYCSYCKNFFFLALNTTAATQQIHFLLLREAQCQTFCSQTCTRNSSFAIAPKAYFGTAICAAVIILWGI